MDSKQSSGPGRLERMKSRIRVHREGDFSGNMSSMHNSDSTGLDYYSLSGEFRNSVHNSNARRRSSIFAKRRSYVVQSIHRGTLEWTGVLKPFVANLVFRSIASHSNAMLRFKPYSCQGSLLFVDLSGYSRITAALAHKGAHVLSTVVNAYLSRLLSIIRQHGGDVIKFAGDAILAVWEGDEQELEMNVLCAARCAVALQQQAGEHPVKGTNLAFHIHCGLACGSVDSEVFEATTADHMQRLYHFVGGESVAEVGELVDCAGRGEIAISRGCFTFIESDGTYSDGPNGTKILKSLKIEDPELLELMEYHTGKLMDDRTDLREDRNHLIEEDFIHSSVLAHLNHGGLSPTQIAQMRNLCVLFIAMTSNGNSVNWLMEVQTILDRNRCPIVQIIHDDKGVHIVAAVNLYEAVPEASWVGLQVCQELTMQRVGSSVGIAQGNTFCGVTGSTDACRWDITGPAVVRAARLMQFALQYGIPEAIDRSLYQDPMAATRMQLFNESVELKGAPEPICVYTLSNAKLFSAFHIMRNVHGGVHDSKVQEIQNHISCRTRSAVLITGIPLAGMGIVCQRAAGYSDLVPYNHLSDVSAGTLQLARTIATWFSYNQDKEIQEKANNVTNNLESNCWSCAHDECVSLIQLAIEKRQQACFVVDRIQDLDRFSMSLIRSCLREPINCGKSVFKGHDSFDSRDGHGSAMMNMSLDHMDLEDERSMGQICFLCTHMTLYGARTAEDVVEDITRSHTSFKIPIIEIGEASKEELRTMFRDLEDIDVEDRWLDAHAEASGYCAEYFLERTAAVRNLCAEQWREGKHAVMEITEDLELYVPPGLIRKNKDLKVMDIRAEVAMRFSQIYDDIPPMCQMAIKIVTIAVSPCFYPFVSNPSCKTWRGFYKLPFRILYKVMNDLVDQDIDQLFLDSMIDEMVNLCILKVEDRDERTVGYGLELDGSVLDDSGGDLNVLSMQSPAFSDIVLDVCTPIQIRSIAKVLIDRLEDHASGNFQVYFVIGSLHSLMQQERGTVEHLWSLGYQEFLKQSADWPRHRQDKWKEIIDDEIREAGVADSRTLLGDDFFVPVRPRKRISPCLSMLKTYAAPVALGPMGLSFTVVFRNTFHEYGTFFGASTQVEGEKLRNATGSACGRYMMQMTIVENFLKEWGYGAPSSEIDAEMEMFSFLANPATSADDVETKAVLLVEEIVPRFIEHRLQRLYKLVGKLKELDLMEVLYHPTLETAFNNADTALARAFKALQTEKIRNDAAQDAFMILATMNWKPRSIPEHLPMKYHQNVDSVRDATLKRLSDADVVMLRHRQSIDDFEAFLILTVLLYQANDDGLC